MYAEFPEEVLPFWKRESYYTNWLVMLNVLYRIRGSNADTHALSANNISFRQISSSLRNDDMTTKRKTESTQKPVRNAGWTSEVVWANVRLDDTAIQEIMRLAENPEVVAAHFVLLAESAKNLYVKFDDKTGSVCAGYIAVNPDANDALYGVSAWSDVAYDAICALVYKWFYLMDKVWPEVVVGASSRFR
jgi:hypothetical protein